MEFKIVILDDPNNILLSNGAQTDRAKCVLADLIQLRQVCYTGVKKNFIAFDAHDLCATHALLYDVSKVYQPKLVLGLRYCFESRAKLHELELPIFSTMRQISPLFDAEFNEFLRSHSDIINPGFLEVHPEYTFRKTGVPIIEMMLWVMAVGIKATGANGWCGALNEEFKTARWYMSHGDWNKNLDFIHPIMKIHHKLILMNSISDAFLQEGYTKYGSLFNKRDLIAVTKSEIELSSELGLDSTKVA